MSDMVRRVETATGSHIEPPLDPAWSQLEKLAWQAAVVSTDAGIDARVESATYSERIRGHWRPVRGEWFNVQVASSSCGPLDFHAAWTYLNGVAVGARAKEIQ